MNFHHCHHDSSPDVTILHQDDLVWPSWSPPPSAAAPLDNIEPTWNLGWFWSNFNFLPYSTERGVWVNFDLTIEMRVTQRLFPRSLSSKDPCPPDRRLSPMLTWQGPMVWGNGVGNIDRGEDNLFCWMRWKEGGRRWRNSCEEGAVEGWGWNRRSALWSVLLIIVLTIGGWWLRLSENNARSYF